MLTESSKEFSSTLRAWFQNARRALPWREEPRCVYKTTVSEFMLQQTQVDTVLPYFSRWIERFPDFQSLAESDEAIVVKHWEGLGYYSRARNLHKLAKAIAGLDTMPHTLEDWKRFPGIGPYTAAAITSIALNQPNAVVDGNVVRILARLLGVEETFKDNNTAAKYFWNTAEQLISEDNPGEHNEAMMELGATVCTKANPLCTVCPVVSFCAAAKKGIQDDLPKFIGRKLVSVSLDRLWVEETGALLLHQIPHDAKRLANMYELPETHHLGYQPKNTKPWTVKKRGISNQRITESIYKLESIDPNLHSQINSNSQLHWVKKEDLVNITLSGPHKRWISQLLDVNLRS